jgi:CRISPR/Cas system-associated protein Csm6
MKVIITTVGTSLFTNYDTKIFPKYKGLLKSISTDFTSIQNRTDATASKRISGDYEFEIDELIKNIKIFFEASQISDEAKKLASAEIASIIKIAEDDSSETFKVHLLATDTLLSVLAAELIAYYFNTFKPISNVEVVLFEGPDKQFDKQKNSKFIVKNLSVLSSSQYGQGFQNLVQLLSDLVKRYYKKDVIMNVTGGYKGLVPILTVFSQMMNLEMRYLYSEQYEDQVHNKNDLIKIANLPVSYDSFDANKYFLILDDNSLNDIDEDDETKKIIDEAVLKALLVKNKNQTKVSSMGTLFKETIEKQGYALKKDNLGIFFEYKIKEFLDYFNTKTKNAKILRSIDVVPQTEGSRQYATEMDLFIEYGDNKPIFEKWIKTKGKRETDQPLEYAFIEVKAISSVNTSQFIELLKNIRDNFDKAPKEVALFTYTLSSTRIALTKFNGQANMINNHSFIRQVISTMNEEQDGYWKQTKISMVLLQINPINQSFNFIKKFLQDSISEDQFIVKKCFFQGKEVDASESHIL